MKLCCDVTLTAGMHGTGQALQPIAGSHVHTALAWASTTIFSTLTVVCDTDISPANTEFPPGHAGEFLTKSVAEVISHCSPSQQTWQHHEYSAKSTVTGSTVTMHAGMQAVVPPQVCRHGASSNQCR